QAFFAVPYERDKWDTGRDKAEKLVPEPIGRVGQTEPAGHLGQGAPEAEPTSRYDGWCPGYWKDCLHGCPDFDTSRTLFCRKWNALHPEDMAAWDAGREVQ
ncbi:MAG: hypothetical protein LBQ51_01680, partial [Desulfovibrio sp.]|nr:hypothetical protein [Desulfovibrio sp.]